jgi:hypothetical protein
VLSPSNVAWPNFVACPASFRIFRQKPDNLINFPNDIIGGRGISVLE